MGKKIHTTVHHENAGSPGNAPARNKLDAVGIEEICARIAECQFIHRIARDIGVSPTSLHAYLDNHPEMYARARERQGDKLVEDMLAIADDAAKDTYIDADGNTRTDQEVVARSRLRVDARKWLAGKMRPKVYGDKVAVGGDADAPPINMAIGPTLDFAALLEKIK